MRSRSLAGTLEALGHLYHALSRLVDAHAVWGEAIQLYQAQHRTEEAERLRRQLHTDEVDVPEAASRRRGQHRSPASRAAPVPDLWASGTHPQRIR